MHETITKIAAIMARCRLNPTEVGAFAGVAGNTVREALATREMPVRMHTRTALERFAELNASARRRGDLRPVG